MKKQLANLVAFLLVFGAFSACGKTSNNSQSNSSTHSETSSNSTLTSSSEEETSSSYEDSTSEEETSKDSGSSEQDPPSVDENGFKSIFSSETENTLANEETAIFSIDKDLLGQNYIRLKLKTNVQLFGQYTYANVNDPNEIAVEDFFIEASDGVKEVEFKQFLDAFRPNGVGQFDKILKSISLTNKGGATGKCSLLDVAVSNRQFPTDAKMVFLEKDSLKIGADLATGGSFSYLERKDYDGETIDEVVDSEGNVIYGVNYKDKENSTFCSSSVNLINIYDAGRQVQQSYYANVGGTINVTNGQNGYTRGWCFTGAKDGYYWPYNPVQAGDCADNPGQLIDYEVTEDYIYVKTRAMDWGKGFKKEWEGKYPANHNTVVGGVTTKSYMENWYRIEDNVVIVENTFFDWNGFTDMNTVPVHTNELPATFFSSSLSKFVYHDGKELKEHTNIYSQGANNNLTIYSHPEDWYAWINDDNFGVGVYVSNIDYYSITRPSPTSNISDWKNTGAFNAPMVVNPELLSNKPFPESVHTSCYVFNASYVAPVNMWTMKTYDKMKYSYAISIDYIPVMRAQFAALSEDERMQNLKFNEWIK